jgi:hypothetical protein
VSEWVSRWLKAAGAAGIVLGVVVLALVLAARPRAAAQAPAAPRDDVAWEEVSGPRDVAVWRSRTPGGWLVVQAPGGKASVAVYVPDPDHGWGRARPDLPEAQPR